MEDIELDNKMSYRDLTFNNKDIRDYFYSKSDVAPIQEMKYLITHPMHHPNFLDDITLLSEELEDLAAEKGLSNAVVGRLETMAVELVTAITSSDEMAAERLLQSLREYVGLIEYLFRSVRHVPTRF